MLRAITCCFSQCNHGQAQQIWHATKGLWFFQFEFFIFGCSKSSRVCVFWPQKPTLQHRVNHRLAPQTELAHLSQDPADRLRACRLLASGKPRKSRKLGWGVFGGETFVWSFVGNKHRLFLWRDWCSYNDPKFLNTFVSFSFWKDILQYRRSSEHEECFQEERRNFRNRILLQVCGSAIVLLLLCRTFWCFGLIQSNQTTSWGSVTDSLRDPLAISSTLQRESPGPDTVYWSLLLNCRFVGVLVVCHLQRPWFCVLLSF